MRNADQLVSAALATGTFANYVGDGASVPWQVALPISLPAGMTMFVYKAYLDARFPDAFKLHDWCYTPYGALINVTREEADQAMREIIARTSLVDAEIVYTAVHLAGDPYFGVSQTGYSGPQAYVPLDNIGLASGALFGATGGARGILLPLDADVSFNASDVTLPSQLTFIGGGTPMATKIVFKFNGITEGAGALPNIGYTGQAHSFGFSESFWLATNDFATAKNWARNTAGPARAALLPAGVTLIAATIYGQGSGRGIDEPLGFAGAFGNINHANDAILVETRHGSAPNQRRWWVHCASDEVITRGELRISVVDSVFFQSYFNSLADASWLGIEKTNLQSIITVDETGIVTLGGNHPYAVGQHLRVTRTYTAQKRKEGGRYMVESSGPLPSQFKLANWEKGPTTGGQIYQATGAFFAITAGDGPYVVRSGTKRVGRPFDQYRGRQSAKR